MKKPIGVVLSVLVHVSFAFAFSPQIRTPAAVELVEASSRPLIARLVPPSEIDASSRSLGLASMSIELSNFTVDTTALVPKFVAIAADSFELSRSPISLDDIASVVQLQAQYKGQIFARLERILQMSSGALEPLPAEPCLINVIQNERGQVLDVTTDLCEWSTEDTNRVVTAIVDASPLPLPPPGLALGSFLALEFGSHPTTASKGDLHETY